MEGVPFEILGVALVILIVQTAQFSQCPDVQATCFSQGITVSM
jgi:hypothetical protein